MKEKQYTAEQERLARFAKAMGHPARIAILEFLARQECCFFGDIHEVLPISKATVSQHLYCINRENWETASRLFAAFWGQPVCKKESCCE